MKIIAADEATEDIVQEIMEGISEKEGTAIPLLQKVQAKLGYVSPEAIKVIAEVLQLSESEVYGVATFYSEFRLFKPGRHQIKICMGTSCYLRGGRALLEHMTRKLGIRPGQTMENGEFSLETVACLGCCSKSPVMAVDNVLYGGISPSLADNILTRLESES